MEKKILALDFDGVIANSMRELVVVACNTLLSLYPETSIGAGKKVLIDDAVDFLEENDDLVKAFYRIASHAKDAQEYVACCLLLSQGKEAHSRKQFEEFFATIPEGKRDQFQKRFYAERSLLQADMDAWVRLNPPFPAIAEGVKRAFGRIPMVIVTTKDRHSCTSLLHAYGLAFREEDIIANDRGLDKGAHMHTLSCRFGIEASGIIFVDDVPENHFRVKQSGAQCYLATWGYQSGEARRDAKRMGITLLSESGFLALVERIAGEQT
ncbi:TPA: hypothetical protein HA361_05470 [Candidatus Woesearchaeota archaeon]|nr:hypothetical protein [Candidatus Woesearchaeota archaeon]HII68990.1 hypothetical protein [Candidatus Woesearchaeota archaeon]